MAGTPSFQASAIRVGSPLAPFRYPAFRAIWSANLVSNLGTTIQSAAAAWLMTELTTSRTMVALVQASATLPILLFGLLAGAVADNFDRRRVMLWAQASMLASSAILAALTWSGAIGPGSLLALTLLVGAGAAMNQPAWQASVRMQVGRQELAQAISLNALSYNVARSLGPALGGLLLALANASLAFALNALSFVGMIVVLARWRPNAPVPARQPMLLAIRTGIVFCLNSPPIRKLLLRSAAFGLGLSAFLALLPLVARERMQGSEIDFGLMLGTFGLGSIVTALCASPLRRRYGSERVILGATLLAAVATLILARVTHTLPGMLAGFLGGAGWVLAMTTYNVAMQIRAPEAVLGRCLSLYQAVTFGTMALGSWAWGWLADGWGVSRALESAAAWLAVSLLLRVIAPMPRPDEGRVAEERPT